MSPNIYFLVLVHISTSNQSNYIKTLHKQKSTSKWFLYYTHTKVGLGCHVCVWFPPLLTSELMDGFS
jgi:hypothetical protein